VLIHDFGGCETTDVLAAVGLSVADLFPERISHRSAGAKSNHWHARKEAFESIHRECLVVAIAAENMAAGVALADCDRERLTQAAQRIRHTVEVCR